MSKYAGHPDQCWGYISYSQHGEDFLILNLFKMLGVEKPNYLDLGAHDPEIISNTKLLYDRGSRGVNVEANPILIEKFKQLRPDDINVNVGVSYVPGEHLFYMYSDTSGRNTFSETEVQSLEGVLKARKSPSIKCVTLTTILEEYCNGVWPQFLSCDIEGLDYDVLNTTAFTADKGPWVVCVETRNSETIKMRKMFERRGYFTYARMGENLIFVPEKLKELVY